MKRSLSVIYEAENAKNVQDINNVISSLISIIESTRNYLKNNHSTLIEIIIVGDTKINLSIEEKILNQNAGNFQDINLKILNADGISYFQKKNLGAYFARSDYVIFTDSDCFYSANYIQQMFNSINNFDSSVVYGQTFPLKPKNGLGFLTAYTWLFPINSAVAQLQNNKWGNNFIATRQTIIKTPFPRLLSKNLKNIELKIERVVWQKKLELEDIKSIEIGTSVFHLQIDKINDWIIRNIVHGIADYVGEGISNFEHIETSRPVFISKWLFRRKEIESIHKADLKPIQFIGLSVWSYIGDASYVLGRLYAKRRFGIVKIDWNYFGKLNLTEFELRSIQFCKS